LTYGKRLAAFPDAICGTGDHFASGPPSTDYDVMDMEGFALARVCQSFNIPFLCLKYISDGADDAAATDWTLALLNAAQGLSSALKTAHSTYL
jgi:adenosylhomocysteine nucleosidase